MSMEFHNIDLIYSSSGDIIYPGTSYPFYINQYATNYKLRVGFYYGDDEWNKLSIKNIKAVIFNGKTNPARILYQTESTEYDGKEVDLYVYQLTQYDTYLYNENLEITVITTLNDKNSTQLIDTITIPMTKQSYGKLIPQPLENDGVLNEVVNATSRMQEELTELKDNLLPYEITPEPFAGTIMFRDENGRAKVQNPAEDKDIANKEYVEDRLTSKLNNITYTPTTNVIPTIQANSREQSFAQLTSSTLTKWSIPQRDNNGNISVGAPTDNNHASTKKYVDDTCKTTLNSAKTYADNAVAKLVDSSPEALNTLNELAAALGDDPNFSSTMLSKISNLENSKLSKVTGSTTHPQAYVKSSGGGQSMMSIVNNTNSSETWADFKYTIAQRDASGALHSPDPIESSHLTTKNYVDTENTTLKNYVNNGFIPKETSTSTLPRVVSYAANSTTPSTLAVANSDSSVYYGRLALYRDVASGITEPGAVLVTKTPTRNYQAANKKYVDDKFEGAFNGKIVAGTGIGITSSTTSGTTEYTVFLEETVRMSHRYRCDFEAVGSLDSEEYVYITFHTKNLLPVSSNDILTISDLSSLLCAAGFTGENYHYHINGNIYNWDLERDVGYIVGMYSNDGDILTLVGWRGTTRITVSFPGYIGIGCKLIDDLI